MTPYIVVKILYIGVFLLLSVRGKKLEAKSNTHRFNVRQREYELFFASDGQVELYETKNPGKTGFIFPDKKKFITFINMITDLVEQTMESFNENKESS
jgi:hypothetical protein